MTTCEEAVPWFYFHLRTPKGLDLDDTGLELDGVEAAYLEAFAAVEGMACDLQRRGVDPLCCAFEITDGINGLLMDVPFSEALQLRRRGIRWTSR